MTNLQPPEAASLLDEVERRRRTVRRRLGNGWFEMAVFGTALLAAALAGFVASRLDAPVGVACVAVFALAYLVVGARYVWLRRRFGVGFGGFTGLLFSVLIFAGCSLAAWVLEGAALVVAIALLPTTAVLAMAWRWRQPWLLGLAAVMLAGGLVGLLPGASGWTSVVIYGVGFIALAALLLWQVSRRTSA